MTFTNFKGIKCNSFQELCYPSVLLLLFHLGRRINSYQAGEWVLKFSEKSLELIDSCISADVFQ